MSNILSAVTAVTTFLTEMMTDLLDVIVANPVLFLFVGLGVAGLIAGKIKGLLHF
jgi:hypothetical protein